MNFRYIGVGLFMSLGTFVKLLFWTLILLVVLSELALHGML